MLPFLAVIDPNLFCLTLLYNYFQGEIIPTSTGGAQIVFNDVEKLTQKSPEKSPERMATRRSKRSYEEAGGGASVGSRVAAFENKLGSAKKYRFR